MGIAACTLFTDLGGFSKPDADASAPPTDASSASDTPTTFAPETGVDAGCVATTTLDAELTSTIPSELVPRTFAIEQYPRIEDFFGSPAAVLIPQPTFGNGGEPRLDVHSNLWFSSAIALVAFDVAFDFHVRCAASNNCADGLGFGWFDTVDTTTLVNDNTGAEYGFPNGRGAAVLLDTYRNDPNESPDPPAPSIQLIGADATRTVISSSPKDFLGNWRRLEIQKRGATVIVKLDGADLLIGNVPAFDKGLVGIGSSTGGQSNSAAIRKLSAKFYSCTP